MKRALIALAISALVACGTNVGSRPNVAAPAPAASSSAPPAPAASTAPTATSGDARETRLISRMLRRVETARGLDAKKTVPGVLLDRPSLIARVKSHVSRELPPEAIREEGLALQLLGFVPTQFDYEAAEYQLLQDQLAGYYEPADGTMYMASDLGDDEAEATLAHELVHALQDQRWNLEERSKYRPGDGDRSEAVSALAEGDATSAMFDVMIARAAGGKKSALDLPDELFSEQIREGMNQGPGASAPHVMRTSLAAPYIYGTLFVHSLRRRGGWDAVNRAWDDPPTTSEQILHVDKWLAHEAPLKVNAPSFAALGAGWQIADEDSEGELGARIAFEEWMDPKAAADASSSWGGDRGVLLTNGDRAAFAWRLRFDPAGKAKDEHAARTYTAITRALDKTLGPVKSSDPAFVCRERADRGPLAVLRAGADLVFVAGPATTSASGWASAGDCALARKWTREIAQSAARAQRSGPMVD